jgi:hypothetical protein
MERRAQFMIQSQGTQQVVDPDAADQHPAGRPDRNPPNQARPAVVPFPMNAGSQLFAVLAALIYIVVFPLESFFLRHPAAQKFLNMVHPRATVPPLISLAALLF